MKIIDYCILSNNDMKSFVDDCKMIIQQGWQPFGQAFTINRNQHGIGYECLTQAFVRYEALPEPVPIRQPAKHHRHE